MKRIMTLSAYKVGRVTKRKHDGNREFIGGLACVSAIRTIQRSAGYMGPG
jgi:hypothetical protein